MSFHSNGMCLRSILLRTIDRFVDFDGIRSHSAPFYSETGRPSIDPELLIRMLIVGYSFGVCSERRLCEEVQFEHGELPVSLGAHRCQLRSSLRSCTAWEGLGGFKLLSVLCARRAG
jgi:hypothetical protein